MVLVVSNNLSVTEAEPELEPELEPDIVDYKYRYWGSA